MPEKSFSWAAKIITALVRLVTKVFYRLRVEGLENLPATGGVVVAPNHVSYMDPVMMELVSPRPLRALAYSGLQTHVLLRAVFHIFHSIPLSPDHAKAALHDTVQLLKDGAAVLIFPEGRMSRTGELQHLTGGFNLLARQANVPVIPVHLQGLWGSIFSFERGRYFWKWPLRIPLPVTIRFGPPLAAGEATGENLKKALEALARQTPEPVNAPLRHTTSGPEAPLPPVPEPVPNQAPSEHQAGEPLVDLGEAEFYGRRGLDENLGAALVESLSRRRAQTVLVDRTAERQAITGAKLLAVSLALAGRLRKTVPEPRVGIVLPPSLGGFIANYAVLLAGKTPVNLNFTLGKQAMATVIAKAGLGTTITSDVFREKITARKRDLPWTKDVRNLPDEIAAILPLKILIWWLAAKILPGRWLVRLARLPREGGNREAAVLFTSGSSGEPKGVVLTHRNILGNSAQVDACGILPPRMRLLANLPLFHSFGFTVTLWYALLHDVAVVTVPSPLDVRRGVDAITEEQVTVLLGTPTFLRGYVKRAEPSEMSSLRFVIAGAEKTPEGFREAWEKKFGSQFCEGYGLTETSPVVAVNLPAAPGENEEGIRKRKRSGSVGRLLPGLSARVADPETGADRGLNETGLLLLRGINVFPRYLDQPEESAKALKDGWFDTGDLVKIDGDGFLSIEGRLSRFSKVGGEMVPHETVEAAVMKAFDLKPGEKTAVAVAARPDPGKGEQLVLLTPVDLNADELREKLKAAGLPNLWIPHVIIKVDALPMLGTGKLDLRRIKDLAKEN